MRCAWLLPIILVLSGSATAQPAFRVIGFYTAKDDKAHISFVHEANRWFSTVAQQNKFTAALAWPI
jgi:hypothetical protein